MKKAFILLAVVVFAAACSKKTANTTTSADGKTVYYTTSAAAAADAKNAKYQIIDQEFDNMLAPDSDYDSLSDYELQACGASYLPPAEKLKKPQVKAAAAAVKADAAKAAAKTSVSKSKKVTNTTNIYYVDGPTPNVPVQSTSTTTTYSSDGSVISTTTK